MMSCEYKWKINVIIKDHNICIQKNIFSIVIVRLFISKRISYVIYFMRKVLDVSSWFDFLDWIFEIAAVKKVWVYF